MEAVCPKPSFYWSMLGVNVKITGVFVPKCWFNLDGYKHHKEVMGSLAVVPAYYPKEPYVLNKAK